MDEHPNEKPARSEQASPVLFFDGVCGLCNASVDWVLLRDKKESFRFSPLQGKAAAQLLPESDRLELSSIVLFDPGRQPPLLARKSEAVREILTRLGGQWRFLSIVMALVPLSLRDLVYDLVAQLRYRIWGKRDTCRIPTPAERRRFLD